MGTTGNTVRQFVLWASIAMILAAGLLDLAFSGPMQTIAPAISIVMFIIFAFTHGTMNFGLKNLLVLFGITFLISWIYETLSIHTGFPFGNYHYTDLLGLKLGPVPLVIMPAYFGVLYSSWIIAHVLLDKFSFEIKGSEIIILPFIASFFMVMWDLIFDPYASTIRKYWIWEDGGAYFGVPFSNYMGWFLCVFTILFLFALYMRFRENRFIQKRANYMQPLVFYGFVSLRLFINPFFEKASTIKTLDNHSWNTADIINSTALVGLFTVVFVLVLSFVKLIKHFSNKQIS